VLGPRIEGKLIDLAPVEHEYLPNFCRWSRDPVGIRYLLLQHPFTMEDEEAWYAQISGSPNDVIWAILREGRHIGNIGLHRIDWRNRSAGGGIWIGEICEHGKGFGSEAMALRTRYAFLELGLNKVMTSSIMDNVASRRAAMRAGYHECGIRRQHFYRDGKWHDEWLGEVLRDEWLAGLTAQTPAT